MITIDGDEMDAARGAAKRLAERAIRSSGAAALARMRRRGDALILAYHNIVPDGEQTAGDSSLHLPQKAFARQLDLIMRTHDIETLDRILTPRRSRRPRIAITFDDACAGAVTAGVAELARRSLPATIFVAPHFIGGRSFWWDALAGPDGGPLAESQREHALTRLCGLDDNVREWATASGQTLRDVPAHQVAATESDLHAAGRLGMSLGSHTWSHPSLPTLSGEILTRELRRPLDWLRERFDNVIPWLAYPYGHASAATENAAAASGYAAAVRVDGGWLRQGAHPFRLPRLNVPSGLSIEGFELRVSGLLDR